MIHLIIVNFITLLIIHFTGANLFLNRFDARKYTYLILVFFWILISIINIRGISGVYTPIFLIISYYFYLECQFLGNTSIKILTALLISFSISIAEFTSACILIAFISLCSQDLIYIIALYLTMLISIVLIVPYIFISKSFIKLQQSSFVWTALVLPFFSYILVVLINRYYFQLINESNFLFFFLFIILGILLSNYVMIYLNLKSLNVLKVEAELKLEKEEKKSLTEKFYYLDNYYRSKFNFLHDLLHSITFMTKLIEEEKYPVLKNTLNKLAQTTYEEFNILYSNSNALNLSLMNYMTDIQKNNISVRSTALNDFTCLEEKEQIILYSAIIKFYINIVHQQSIQNPYISFYVKKMNNVPFLKIYCKYNKSIDFDIEKLRKILIDNDKLNISFHHKYYEEEKVLCLLIYKGEEKSISIL